MNVTCPFCEKSLMAGDDSFGKLVRCPGCERTFTVTRERGTAPATPPPAEPEPEPAPPEDPEEGRRRERLAELVTGDAAPRRDREGTSPGRSERRGAWAAVRDFFAFRTMISPVLIRVLFVLLTVLGLCAAAYWAVHETDFTSPKYNREERTVISEAQKLESGGAGAAKIRDILADESNSDVMRRTRWGKSPGQAAVNEILSLDPFETNLRLGSIGLFVFRLILYLVAAALFLLVIRLAFEATMVFFSIHDGTKEIRRLLEKDE